MSLRANPARAQPRRPDLIGQLGAGVARAKHRPHGPVVDAGLCLARAAHCPCGEGHRRAGRANLPVSLRANPARAEPRPHGGMSNVLSRGSSHLAIDLLREVVQLGFRELQGGGLVAQNAPGRMLDALPQLLDTLTGVAGCLGGIVGYSQLHQLLGDLEGIGDLLVGRFADRVVEVLGQEGLGFFGLLDRGAHLVQELIELFGLLLELLAGLLAFAAAAKRALGFTVQRVDLFGKTRLDLRPAAAPGCAFRSFRRRIGWRPSCEAARGDRSVGGRLWRPR